MYQIGPLAQAAIESFHMGQGSIGVLLDLCTSLTGSGNGNEGMQDGQQAF
jgi:hypothetical protein